jgi:hypothetical protein
VVRQEYNVLALVKGDERYVFVYDDTSRAELLELFHARAADAQFSFSWFDAAVLTEKAWEQAHPEQAPEPHRRI